MIRITLYSPITTIRNRSGIEALAGKAYSTPGQLWLQDPSKLDCFPNRGLLVLGPPAERKPFSPRDVGVEGTIIGWKGSEQSMNRTRDLCWWL